QYTIDQIRPQPDGTPSKIKVKVHLNRHGIFAITQASIVDKNEESTEIAMDTKGGIEKTTVPNVPTTNEPTVESKTPAGNNQQDGDEDEDEDEPKKTTTKSKMKGIDLPIIVRVSGTTKQELDQLIEQEHEMISSDKREKERSDAKNAVEEYVYDMRGKLDGGEYERYSDERNRQRLLNDLRTTENWLYNQGMHQDKYAYVERLNALKNLGDPIRNRYYEAENRQYYMQDFIKSLKQIEDAIQIWQTKSSDKYSHIDKSDIEKVYRILTEKRKWYDQTANRFNTLRQHEDPAVLCAQIKQERDALERECWNILNKPKPKADLPKDTSADGSRRQAPPSDGKQQQNQSQPPPPSSSGKKLSSSKKQSQQPNTQQSSMETD
ncbi:unnamed protein product, partial [Rotaria sp. Silwood2]